MITVDTCIQLQLSLLELMLTFNSKILAYVCIKKALVHRLNLIQTNSTTYQISIEVNVVIAYAEFDFIHIYKNSTCI